MGRRWRGIGLVSVLLVVGGAAAVQAHGGDPSLIHSCVKSAPPNQGLTLIVDPSDVCAAGFDPVDWSIAGPPGASAVHREPPAASATTIVDSGGVGQHTSVTVGADGKGLISYYDVTNGDLKVAHCSNVACTSSTDTTLDSTGDVGQYTSIAIGTDGLGIISYYDVTNGNLKVAHCSDAVCTAATITTQPAFGGDYGKYTSIVTSSLAGFPQISYYDVTNHAVAVITCAEPLCVGAVPPFFLDGLPADAGQYTSIVTGSDGFPIVSYYDVVGGNLRVAHCNDAICSGPATLTNVDTAGNTGQYTSLAIGADGFGLISYYDVTNANLRVAHCSNVACSTSTRVTFDGPGTVGQYTSITVGADGFPLIAYYDATNLDLKLARCSNLVCSAGLTRILESGGNVGQYASITIGADGLGLVALYGATNNVLRALHCASTPCLDYFRSR